jgi:hypothetical protein
MKRTRTIAYIVLALVAICLVAPLVMYAHTFGTAITSSHPRWAEFGTAMSGIYSPLLTLLTLAVLVAQVFLQRRQTALQHQINEHERDQAYLVQARADIEFYAARVAEALNSTALPGVSLRAHLHKHFQPSTGAELDSPELRQLAASIHHLLPASFDLWAAVYPILMGMDAGKETMFNLAYVSSYQKLIALLGFESCVALDNFHRARSEGLGGIKYVFSPLLSKE